jgi:hypothetical protein
MCTATAFKSHTCSHKWLTINLPCGPGMGFDNCLRHAFSGQTGIFGGPKFIPAPAHSCPTCNKKDQYDGNKTRMVLRRMDMFGTGYWNGGNIGGLGGYANDGCGYRSGYGRAYGTGNGGTQPIICCAVM